MVDMIGVSLTCAAGFGSRRAADVLGKGTVGQGLGEVQPADLVRTIEIRQRACDPQHAVIAARGEAHGLGGIAQQLLPCASGFAISSSKAAGASALVRICGRPAAA